MLFEKVLSKMSIMENITAMLETLNEQLVTPVVEQCREHCCLREDVKVTRETTATMALHGMVRGPQARPANTITGPYPSRARSNDEGPARSRADNLIWRPEPGPAR